MGSKPTLCSTCIEHLCKNCCHDHKRFKATRSHVILTDNEMPKDASVFKRMASLILCPFHPDREVEFKCCYHEKFVCPLCLRDAHRYCSQIENVSNIGSALKLQIPEVISKLMSVKDKGENCLLKAS